MSKVIEITFVKCASSRTLHFIVISYASKWVSNSLTVGLKMLKRLVPLKDLQEKTLDLTDSLTILRL